jgi:hypothetical protein
MLCWEKEIPFGYFSKNLNDGMLHGCQEPVQFSLIFIVIPTLQLIAIS